MIFELHYLGQVSDSEIGFCWTVTVYERLG